MKLARNTLFTATVHLTLLVAGARMESSAAVTLFDNLSAGSPNGSFYVTNTQWTGQAFATTGTAFVLNQVSLRLWNQNGTTGGYQIQIWDSSGASGSPGAQVGGAIHTGLAEDLGTNPGGLLNLTGLNISLNAGTSYYLIALGTGLTDIEDIFFPSPGTIAWDATDVNLAATYDTGDSGANWFGPYSQNLYMGISGESVPEVSSVALSALAIGASMCRRGRC